MGWVWNQNKFICESNAKFSHCNQLCKGVRFKLLHSENLLAGDQDVPAKCNSVSNYSINQYNVKVASFRDNY